MFKSLREKLFGAKKKASDDLETDLNLEYEKFTPEERETGSLIKESQLENRFWDLEVEYHNDENSFSWLWMKLIKTESFAKRGIFKYTKKI